MGLAVSDDGRTLALATQFQVHRFDNRAARGQTSADGFDAVYAPHAGWVTGDLDAHDVGFGADGRPLFVNTLFSCIATVSDSHSFKPLWKPAFISRLAAEDRCHLNGLALGKRRAALCDGRVAIRCCRRLARPAGRRGYCHRRQEPGNRRSAACRCRIRRAFAMAACGFSIREPASSALSILRRAGSRPLHFALAMRAVLAFIGNFAVVGLSLARENRTFSGLPLDEALKERDTVARCGLAIVDLNRWRHGRLGSDRGGGARTL